MVLNSLGEIEGGDFMVGKRKGLPKALTKTPKPFRDTSGLMNVPSSISRLPASGVKVPKGALRQGGKAIRQLSSKRTTLRGIGKKEGQRLSKRAGKRASRLRP